MLAFDRLIEDKVCHARLIQMEATEGKSGDIHKFAVVDSKEQVEALRGLEFDRVEVASRVSPEYLALLKVLERPKAPSEAA